MSTMISPQQKDLFSKRWRKIKRWEPSELQLQISLIDNLKYRCRPGVVYFHVANGEERDDRVAAKLKAMGVLPGVADLVFVWLGEARLQLLFLELKRRGAKLEPEQRTFADRIRAAGADYDMADNIDTALDILSRRGILKQ